VQLAFEDGDAVDDGIERIARDGEADVPLWVEQSEAEKVGIQQRAHLGPLPGLKGNARELLLFATSFESEASLGDLLFGGGLAVEVDARKAAAIKTWTMIGGARPGRGDKCNELSSDGGLVESRIEHKRWHLLSE
jgi:hypothetical protein